MENMIEVYHKYPHFVLYWAFCKSKYDNLADWAKDIEELSKDRGSIEYAVREALQFYYTYQIK